MIPFAFVLFVAAPVLIAFGITGRPPWETFTAALRGEPRPPQRPSPLAVADLIATGTTTVATSVADDVLNRPGSAGGTGDVASWQPLGRGEKHGLASGAHAAFAEAERLYGGPIWVTSAGRSRAEQIDLRRRNGCPDPETSPSSTCRVPTARPGTSQHERGNAIDVDSGRMSLNDPRLVGALTRAGWCRYSPGREPWHWSYRVCA